MEASDTYEDHRIILRDISDGETPHLVAEYVAINQTNRSYTEGRHVSTRLPVECLVLFDGGSVDVADLSAEERAWLRAESGARSNEIDFEGTETGPAVVCA